MPRPAKLAVVVLVALATLGPAIALGTVRRADGHMTPGDRLALAAIGALSGLGVVLMVGGPIALVVRASKAADAKPGADASRGDAPPDASG